METSTSGLEHTIQVKDATIFAREILNLEKKYWMAMKERDLATALSLTDFPCLMAGAHGIAAVSKKQFTEMFNSQKKSLGKFNIDENKTEVRQLGPDTAVIAYQVHASFNQDGENKITDAADTSTWIKRDGKWLCAMHTEAELSEQH